ncbi:hypothetical protein GQ53DRAFT_821952 [Thozetella sp. PMI_491]|nr:hypothetical protein GQ53DRAFT_821952 [Thozetella sp. PMI_491]
MKHGLSQQGKTPSQSQHGAVATPPVSTPFSAAHAAFSPHGPKSSPQQVKKSPATSATLGHQSNAPMNFDSPSAAAAFGALNLGVDLGLDNVNVGALGLGALGRNTEDDKLKRFEYVIEVLNRSKGVVSEEGLERLIKRVHLECMWDNDIENEAKKTLIVAGSALELIIVLHSHIVQSVSLNFPDSAEMVNKHASKAGEILYGDLKLAPGQMPLTKRLDKFAANLERVAVLDKLSVIPGLNLYEAVAGIYESLSRLHHWELQKAREDPALTGKDDNYLRNLVLCTKSGQPVMDARGRVGFGLEYWKEKHLWRVPPPELADYVEETEKTWALLVGCGPLRDLTTTPVRISDRWIAAEIEKMPGLLSWEEPESTLLPPLDHEKDNEAIPADSALLGPRLPEAGFVVTLDPPLVVEDVVWNSLLQMGLGVIDPGSNQAHATQTYDMILFPSAPGVVHMPGDPREIAVNKKVEFVAQGETKGSLRHHANTLYIHKPAWGGTLKEITFSHPRLLINMIPTLRQYALLSTILENSFGDKPDPPEHPLTHSAPSVSATKQTNTVRDDFAAFMEQANRDVPTGDAEVSSAENPLKVDVTLTLHHVPRLQVVFPFQTRTATVNLEIRENGQVHVESQDVLDESNGVAPNGRHRTAEDIGKLLETFEHIGKWCEFLRTRWA